MIKLNSSRTLKAVLAGAVTTAQPIAAVGYNDKSASGFDGDCQLFPLSDATPVVICDAPASGSIRHIDYLTIRNYDSAQVAVMVYIDQGGTAHDLITATLDAGEMLGFTHSAGWYVNTADGSRKSGAVQDLSGYLTILAAAAGYQPLDADLSAIAALATTSYGRAFLALADAAAGRTALGLGTAATAASSAFDAAGAAAAAQAASQPLDSDLTAIAALATTSYGRSLLEAANAAGLRTLAGIGNIDNTSDANKPVSTAQAAADAAILASANATAASLVVGLIDDRGNFDASGNAFPSSGGSGAAGAILKGDLWTVSVAGTLGGHAVTAGDLVRALVDSPGSTDANWALTENNIGYVAENAANKNASGGYAGLTLFKLNVFNALGTVASFFTSLATTARTYTLPDKDGTVAMTSDITGTNSGTNTGDQTITLTGDVTGSGTGGFVATIANAAVTLAKMANMATASVFYRKTAGTGAPEVQTLATLKTDLGLTGTNSGDETAARIAALGHGATAKTVLVDGDEVFGADSASSFSLIRTVWSDVRTYLAGYFALKGAITGSALTMATGKLLGRNTASTGAIEEIMLGTGLSMSGTTLNASAGGATLGANTFTDTQTITQGTANKSILASTGYSLTGSDASSAISLTGTWDTSGTPALIYANIIDTASNASSTTLLRFEISSVLKMFVLKSGAVCSVAGFSTTTGAPGTTGLTPLNSTHVLLAGTSVNFTSDSGTTRNARLWTGHLDLGSATTIAWSSTSQCDGTLDTGFSRLSAGLVGLGNGSNASVAGDLKLRGLCFGSTFTVGTLPAASTAGDGMTYRVTDLSAPAIGSAPSGSGSVHGLVTSNGTSYTVTQFG